MSNKSFALDKGKPRESVGRKATGLPLPINEEMAAELPNCGDHEGKRT